MKVTIDTDDLAIAVGKEIKKCFPEYNGLNSKQKRAIDLAIQATCERIEEIPESKVVADITTHYSLGMLMTLQGVAEMKS